MLPLQSQYSPSFCARTVCKFLGNLHECAEDVCTCAFQMLLFYARLILAARLLCTNLPQDQEGAPRLGSACVPPVTNTICLYCGTCRFYRARAHKWLRTASRKKVHRNTTGNVKSGNSENVKSGNSERKLFQTNSEWHQCDDANTGVPREPTVTPFNQLHSDYKVRQTTVNILA